MYQFTVFLHYCLNRCSSVAMMTVVGLLLAGCATREFCVNGVYKESIPVDAMTNPLDMKIVCVLEDPEVAIDGVQLAMEEGIRRFGSKALFLEPQAGPQACPMVVAYEIRGYDGEMYSIHFQTYENSIPKIQAHGKSPIGRPLTFDGIANYTLQLLRKTKERRQQGILTGDLSF